MATNNEIIDYIMDSPENTNPNVLRGMLENELPIASSDTLGGIKVGSGLSITNDGVLSASGGSGVGPLIITFDSDTGACDHTWQEIYDALAAEQMVLYRQVVSFSAFLAPVVAVLAAGESTYSIYLNPADMPTTPFATAESADGYPVVN